MFTLASTTRFLNADSEDQDIIDAFFENLKLPGGIHKTTKAGRLESVDKDLIDVLNADGIRLGRCIDVGVSSGISTFELVNELMENNHNPEVIGVDSDISAHLFKCLPFLSVLFDKNYFPLQLDFKLFGFWLWRRKLDWITGLAIIKIIIQLGLRFIAVPLILYFQRFGVCLTKEIRLIQSTNNHTHHIQFIEDDMISYLSSCSLDNVRLIRFANVLNYDFIGNETKEYAVCHSIKLLSKSGGYLVLVQTNEIGLNLSSIIWVDKNQNCQVKSALNGGWPHIGTIRSIKKLVNSTVGNIAEQSDPC